MRVLLERQARVVLAARRLEPMLQLVRDCNADERALVVRTDVSQLGDLRELVRATLERFGCIDAVVNNAGLGISAPLEQWPPTALEQVVTVNLLAPMWLTRLALPRLLERERSLVANVASMSARVPVPFQAPYAAAKGGLRDFGTALRRELAGTGVHVLTVFPGVVETEMSAAHIKRAAEVGFRMPVQQPDWAARRIAEAMLNERSEVIIGGFQDRMLAWAQSFAPRFMDRVIGRVRPKLEAIVDSGAEELDASRTRG